jgi:hypothetical protein
MKGAPVKAVAGRTKVTSQERITASFRRFENCRNVQVPLSESDLELLNIEPPQGIERLERLEKAQYSMTMICYLWLTGLCG